jgi:hypothetical protein
MASEEFADARGNSGSVESEAWLSFSRPGGRKCLRNGSNNFLGLRGSERAGLGCRTARLASHFSERFDRQVDAPDILSTS